MEQLVYNELVEITTNKTSKINASNADENNKESILPGTTGITNTEEKVIRTYGNCKLKSKIEWTGISWNPMTGCKMNGFSEGCKNCYARSMAIRWQEAGKKKYHNGFKSTMHWDLLKEPYSWKKPQLVFVCSMGDLFNDDVTDEFIYYLFKVMNDTPHHTYQILTKNTPRLVKMAPTLQWGKSIWCGVTVESNKYLHRIDHLRSVGASTKFISAEPLLSSLSLSGADISGVDLVICQGESGPNARPIQAQWVREIKDLCAEQNVKFFFKGWGGFNKKTTGCLLDGKEYKALPDPK